MAPELVDGLRALSHTVEATHDTYTDIGSWQLIRLLSNDREAGYVADSDSRRDGQAVRN